MEELIVELYKDKINFKFEFGRLTVGQEFNAGRYVNKVTYNHYNDGWWHVEHHYKGDWNCEPFETMEEVLKFFIDRECE